MRTRLSTMVLAAGLLAVAGPARADHNSQNGEGWANMPNDIHNTRVETRENDDNEAFRDFVRHGAGSESVNRFDDGETQPRQAAESKGQRESNAGQGESDDAARQQSSDRTAARDQARTARQPGTATGTASRASSARQSTTLRRGGTGRRGGGRN